MIRSAPPDAPSFVGRFCPSCLSRTAGVERDRRCPLLIVYSLGYSESPFATLIRSSPRSRSACARRNMSRTCSTSDATFRLIVRTLRDYNTARRIIIEWKSASHRNPSTPAPQGETEQAAREACGGAGRRARRVRSEAAANVFARPRHEAVQVVLTTPRRFLRESGPATSGVGFFLECRSKLLNRVKAAEARSRAPRRPIRRPLATGEYHARAAKHWPDMFYVNRCMRLIENQLFG